MNRLIAAFVNDPERLACALHPARAALSTGTASYASLGLGFVQNGDVLLQKRPRHDGGAADVFAMAREQKADALVARFGGPHDGAAEDLDPFRFRSWLFGALGEAPGFAAAREKLLESVPDFLRRNIRGTAWSEHLFHLFLAFLHDGGLLESGSPNAAGVQRALAASTAFFQHLLTEAGAAPAAIAAVACNGRSLVATTRGPAMRYLEIAGINDCDWCGGRPDRGDDRRRVAHEGLRAIVLEADGGAAGRAGWREVPVGACLLVGIDRTATLVAAGA